MKYPDYFEIESIEGLKAFLVKDSGKKRSFSSAAREKGLFVIGFKMTCHLGRPGEQYKCIGFSRHWDSDKIIKLRFRKVE